MKALVAFVVLLQAAYIAHSIIIVKGKPQCPAPVPDKNDPNKLIDFELKPPVNKYALKIAKLIKNYGLAIYLDADSETNPPPTMSKRAEALLTTSGTAQELKLLADKYNQEKQEPFVAIATTCLVDDVSEEDVDPLFGVVVNGKKKEEDCIRVNYDHALYLKSLKSVTPFEAQSVGFKRTEPKGILITTVNGLIGKVGTGGKDAIKSESQRGGGQNTLCFAERLLLELTKTDPKAKVDVYYFVMTDEDHNLVRNKHITMKNYPFDYDLLNMRNALLKYYSDFNQGRLDEYVLELLLRDRYQGFYQDESGFAHTAFDRNSHKPFLRRHLLVPTGNAAMTSYFKRVFVGLRESEQSKKKGLEAEQKSLKDKDEIETIIDFYLKKYDP